MSTAIAKCDWPGCARDAFCTSGNVGGALVCHEHFPITNGPWRRLSSAVILKMDQMSRVAQARASRRAAVEADVEFFP